MSALDSIPVKIEVGTGNVAPLLHEIRHALKGLLQSGEESVIDLQSIPMAPGEEERIERALGVGEVKIELDALGVSRISETAIPGVWVVTHYNGESEMVGKFIEITKVPSIVLSQAPDMEAGLLELEKRLEELD